MTIHLPEPIERSVNEAVESGRFPTVDDALAAAWTAFDQQSSQSQAMPEAREATTREAPRPTMPIWERAAELRKRIPAEEWDKLPVDGAEQLDHYIYGSPKRPTA